jgi:hypothetical protein
VIVACPDDDSLLRLELGELTVNDSQTLVEHITGCAGCRERRAAITRLLADIAGQVPAPDLEGEAFVRRVMARASEISPEVAEPRPGRSRGRLVSSAIAAALAVAAAGFLFQEHAPVEIAGNDASRGTGRFVARGKSETVSVSAEVLVVHDQRLLPLEGRRLNRSGALAVRVTNTSGATLGLMAFARDAAGDIHWLYPAYRDARDNPASVAIETGSRDRLMPEVVQPEDAADGDMQVVTLMLGSPLTVNDVERQLAGRAADADLKARFPSAAVRTWSAIWEEAR